MSNIYQGDNGTVLEFTVMDRGAVVNITGATVELKFITSTRTFTKNAIVTDGTSGICEVALTSADVSESGGYRVQGIVKFVNGNEFASDVITFKVVPRI